MSEELEFMRRSFDALQREMRSMREELKEDIDSIEDKLDRYLEETVVQRTEIKQLKYKTHEHDKILVQGNGQESMTVQVAKQGLRVQELESDVEVCKEHRAKDVDPSEIKKEKIKKTTALTTTVALVISAAIQWMRDGGVF